MPNFSTTNVAYSPRPPYFKFLFEARFEVDWCSMNLDIND